MVEMHRCKWVSVFAGVLVAWSFAVSGVSAAAQAADTPPGPTNDTTASALAIYVAKPDASYEWRVHGRYRYRGSELIELQLHSQTWRDIVWKHQLILIKPPHVVDENRGLLIIGGGRWHDSLETGVAANELPEGGQLFVAIARRLQTVVAVLGQVPYQPLFDRNEDELIAYTFDQYLKTGDAEWPLLLPMVKSAVRAMDASAEAAEHEWRMPLAEFTVLGGSKRGWTTWLTAAVDRRVTALVPTVIDALNMREHFPYQTRTWGKPSDKIQPYTDLDLPEILGSDAGVPLRRIVDPFEYRTAIVQPKLVVLATNDRYFPVDSANLYWDELEGPKYLLYLPNDEHSISDYRRLIPSLRALHASVGSGEPLPALDWEYRWSGEGFELCVGATPRPASVRIWRASSASRDFRDSLWSEEPSPERDGVYSVGVARPEGGYVAAFAEAVFGRGRHAYSFSTNLAILGAQISDDTGPRPLGHAGVCRAR
jgi:PhoPQ-activated pathogenicity-related protein